MSAYFTKLLPMVGLEEIYKQMKEVINSFEKVIFWILIVELTTAFCEELFFRRFFYKVFRYKYNIAYSILYTTFIFLLFHPIPAYIPAFIIVNIIICASYEYSKTLAIPVIIHFVINSFSTISLYYDFT